MSSTTPETRGGGGNDFFPTDPRITLDFLRRAESVLPSGRWVEPAVGDGAIVQAVETWRPGQQSWSVCDIRADAGGLGFVSGTGRAVTWTAQHDWTDILPNTDVDAFTGADVYITNPPFAVAESFARRCFERGGPAATVALLLRLNFLGSYERMPFWREYPKVDTYYIVPRPSFGVNKAGKKGTDSCEYAFFVWGPKSTGAVHHPTAPWKPPARTR